MELFKKVIELIDTNLIYCLIPIILTLILTELIFKNRFETKRALNLIRWVIILYTIIILAFYLIGMALNSEEYSFFNRATGPYKIAYWVMFLSVSVLPFTLLIKKIASKFWYILLVAFAMKIGMYYERFVIIVTSYHQGSLSENGNAELIDIFSFGIVMLFLQGAIIAILTLGVFEMVKKGKNSSKGIMN